MRHASKSPLRPDLFVSDRDQDGLDDGTGLPFPVLAARAGLALSVYKGWKEGGEPKGGNYVWVYEPGPRRFWYYAHLGQVEVEMGRWVAPGRLLGSPAAAARTPSGAAPPPTCT